MTNPEIPQAPTDHLKEIRDQTLVKIDEFLTVAHQAKYPYSSEPRDSEESHYDWTDSDGQAYLLVKESIAWDGSGSVHQISMLFPGSTISEVMNINASTYTRDDSFFDYRFTAEVSILDKDGSRSVRPATHTDFETVIMLCDIASADTQQRSNYQRRRHYNPLTDLQEPHRLRELETSDLDFFRTSDI